MTDQENLEEDIGSDVAVQHPDESGEQSPETEMDNLKKELAKAYADRLLNKMKKSNNNSEMKKSFDELVNTAFGVTLLANSAPLNDIMNLFDNLGDTSGDDTEKLQKKFYEYFSNNAMFRLITEKKIKDKLEKIDSDLSNNLGKINKYMTLADINSKNKDELVKLIEEIKRGTDSISVTPDNKDINDTGRDVSSKHPEDTGTTASGKHPDGNENTNGSSSTSMDAVPFVVPEIDNKEVEDVLEYNKNSIKLIDCGNSIKLAKFTKIKDKNNKIILEFNGSKSNSVNVDSLPDLIAMSLAFYKSTKKPIKILSGYRDIAYQKQLQKENKKTGIPTAEPGHSNHQLGAAIDIDRSIYRHISGGMNAFIKIADQNNFNILRRKDGSILEERHFDHDITKKYNRASRYQAALQIDKAYNKYTTY